MYKNKSLYKNQGIQLIGDKDCYIGIYDNSTNILNNCTHSLYFSNFLSKFILYRVNDTPVSVYGRIMSNFTIKEGSIQYKNENHVSLPQSFIMIKEGVYSIKRKTIKIIVKGEIIGIINVRNVLKQQMINKVVIVKIFSNQYKIVKTSL